MLLALYRCEIQGVQKSTQGHGGFPTLQETESNKNVMEQPAFFLQGLKSQEGKVTLLPAACCRHLRQSQMS